MTLANLLDLTRDAPRYTEQGNSQGGPFRSPRQYNEPNDGARRKLLDVLDQALAVLAEECDDQDEDE